MRLLELFHTARERALTDAELAEVNASLYGLEQTLGIRYVDLGPEKVRAHLTVGSAHLQPAGLVHGGVLATLVESVGSTAALVRTGKLVVGVNNDTDFISSAKSGVLEADVQPVQVGRRTQLWCVEITEGDRLIARGTLRTMTQQ